MKIKFEKAKPSNFILGSIFLIYGILIICFYDKIKEYAGYVIGSTLVLYAIQDFIRILARESRRKDPSTYVDDLVLLLLAGILFALDIRAQDDFVIICIIFAIWSILREAEEIKHIIHLARDGAPFVLNIIESIVVMVLCVIFIFDVYAHFDLHMIILGIELILEVFFGVVDAIGIRKSKKKALAEE